MRLCIFAAAMVSAFFVLNCAVGAQENTELLLDDFEGVISGGEEGTVDFGAGNDSKIEVKASKDIKQHGEQSLEVAFDAIAGGYMWVARGYDLTVKGAGCWLVKPEEIDFSKYNAFSVYVYGANTGTQIAIDVIDNGFEYWRSLIDDNFTGWKEIIIPLNDFFARGDWQPEKADKNGELNFPLKAFQFEPKAEAKGTLYFDYVRLVNQK